MITGVRGRLLVLATVTLVGVTAVLWVEVIARERSPSSADLVVAPTVPNPASSPRTAPETPPVTRVVTRVTAVTTIAVGPEAPRATALIETLGDSTRRREGQSLEEAMASNSTNVEAVPLPEPPAPPPLCHAEHSNAVQVSAAIRHHFPSGWWSTMCRIAWCESNFNPGARNPSGATGLFQIMPMWHDELDVDVWSIWGNTALARYVFNEQGASAWSCY